MGVDRAECCVVCMCVRVFFFFFFRPQCIIPTSMWSEPIATHLLWSGMEVFAVLYLVQWS